MYVKEGSAISCFIFFNNIGSSNKIMIDELQLHHEIIIESTIL